VTIEHFLLALAAMWIVAQAILGEAIGCVAVRTDNIQTGHKDGFLDVWVKTGIWRLIVLMQVSVITHMGIPCSLDHSGQKKTRQSAWFFMYYSGAG